MKTTNKTKKKLDPKKIPAAVVGLGLMGSSITSSLLAAGHTVYGMDISLEKRQTAKKRILRDLTELKREKILKEAPTKVIKRLHIVDDYNLLAPCKIIIESTIENLKTKYSVIKSLESVISNDAIIGVNTSALPITQLQKGAKFPSRILGIHWAEPAYLTRFMEVICGDHSDIQNAETVMTLATFWKKEPTLVRKDIRGFITNRLMYALIREAFYLVDSGVTTIEGVDRCMRNDLGSWITFAGPFRFMDITGIPTYQSVMKELLPTLDCSKKVSKLMNQVADSGARGTANARGFYEYTPAEAKKWEKEFAKFSADIRRLSLAYAQPETSSKSRKTKKGLK